MEGWERCCCARCHSSVRISAAGIVILAAMDTGHGHGSVWVADRRQRLNVQRFVKFVKRQTKLASPRFSFSARSWLGLFLSCYAMSMSVRSCHFSCSTESCQPSPHGAIWQAGPFPFHSAIVSMSSLVRPKFLELLVRWKEGRRRREGRA